MPSALGLEELWGHDALGDAGDAAGHADAVVGRDLDGEGASGHVDGDMAVDESEFVGDGGCGAAAAAAGEGVPGTAFPDLDPDVVAIENLKKLDIGATREVGVGLEGWAVAAGEIFRDLGQRQHAMRIADRGGAVLEFAVAGLDSFTEDISAGADDRDTIALEAHLAHVDADGAAAGINGGAHETTGGFDGEFLIRPDLFLIPEVAGKDAESIAALFGFAAVGIEDPEAEGSLGAGEGAEQDAIAAGAEIAMANDADLIDGKRVESIGGIDDEVIVAESVVLRELHGRRTLMELCGETSLGSGEMVGGNATGSRAQALPSGRLFLGWVKRFTPFPVKHPRDAMNIEESISRFRTTYAACREQIGRVMVGQDAIVEGTLMAILGGGHVLLEGVPGLGKTLLVRTLGEVLNLSFSRVQFTPDLMPADILGTNLVMESPDGRRGFEFQKGPVFAHLVLADEINRATPKTQSAMLEAMQERQVTAGGEVRPLPLPFFVLATQNPIDQEGTYPLPEAQLDRFFFKLIVGYPSAAELLEVVTRTTEGGKVVPEKVLDGAELTSLQQLVRQVPVASHVKDYAVRLVLATHPKTETAAPITNQYLRFGSSPRGAQVLLLAGKVRALTQGRFNVSYEDIQAVAPAALRHRLITNFEAEAEGVTTDMVIAQILQDVPRDAAMVGV